MAYKVTFFIALLATALAFGAAVAHALELPNKIGLGRDQYFTVQRAYDGWAQLAYVLAVQFLALVTLAFLSRGMTTVFWFVIVAILCLVGAQVIFWVYTYPANVATQNWTVPPADWETLRTQWEYSHLAGAVFQLGSMISLFVAALSLPSHHA